MQWNHKFSGKYIWVHLIVQTYKSYLHYRYYETQNIFFTWLKWKKTVFLIISLQIEQNYSTYANVLGTLNCTVNLEKYEESKTFNWRGNDIKYLKIFNFFLFTDKAIELFCNVYYNRYNRERKYWLWITMKIKIVKIKKYHLELTQSIEN